MHDQASVDEWIAAALAFSGLPMSRRAETAEEWRSHLEQLIADKQSTGMTAEQARRAALASFGRPEVLRRQLRRQQRALDRQEAWAKVRKQGWMTALAPVPLVVLLVVVVVARGAPLTFTLLASGLPLLVGMPPALVAISYFAALMETQAKRTRPPCELTFGSRFAYWALVAFAGWAGLVAFPLFLVLAALPLALQPWMEQTGR